MDTLSLVDEDHELASESLMLLGTEHDSQVLLHKGNERKKGQPCPENKDVGASQTKLDPRSCSKIVSIIAKNAQGLEKAIARKHRWNVHVKLDIHKLKTSIRNLTVPVQLLYTKGEVSIENPLENGKFVGIIKNSVSTVVVYFDKSTNPSSQNASNISNMIDLI